jgi:hypothetical protein
VPITKGRIIPLRRKRQAGLKPGFGALVAGVLVAGGLIGWQFAAGIAAGPLYPYQSLRMSDVLRPL